MQYIFPGLLFMLTALLFVLYLACLVYFFHRLLKKSLPWISAWQSGGIYLFKVCLGLAYGYIFLHYYGGDDTWNFFQDSIPEYRKMLNHPGEFFHDFLPDAAFAQAHSFGQGLGFYIRNLEYWVMVKSLAVFNIFSRGNYYIDVLFFEFLSVWGLVLIYRLALLSFPGRRTLLLVAIFFFPPTQFWFSGIRAEGMLLIFIGIILHYSHRYSVTRKMNCLLPVMAGFAGFLVFRAGFLAVFLPAYVGWIITMIYKRKALPRFLIIYGFCIFLFMLAWIFIPARYFAGHLIRAQLAFLELHGNTRLPLTPLAPGLAGLARVFPQALANTFLRPWITEARGALQMLSAAEVVMVWILAALAMIFPAAGSPAVWKNPLTLLFIFYGISQFLVIGYMVPFPGAIVRYKSIPELFLIITIMLSIDWRKIYYKKI